MLSETAAVALIAAIVGTFVALRQWQTAHAKLQLDLFEKRYELFRELGQFMLAHSTDTLEDEYRRLNEALPRFYFLFDDTMGEYAKATLQRGYDHRHSLRKLQRPALTEEQQTQYDGEVLDNYAWFQTEADGLIERFSPYLSVKHWSKTTPF